MNTQQFWIERNVDLRLLTEQINNFFKEKNFETLKEEIPNGYKIFVPKGHAFVTIQGDPNNFAVKLEKLTGKRKRDFSPLMFIEQMFLGGFLILKDLKSDEDWRKLEKDFWRYVENSVLRLTNTAHTRSH